MQQHHLRRIIDRRNKEPRMIVFSVASSLEPNRIPKIIGTKATTMPDPHPCRTHCFFAPPWMANKDTPNRNLNCTLKHKPFARAMEVNGTMNDFDLNGELFMFTVLGKKNAITTTYLRAGDFQNLVIPLLRLRVHPQEDNWMNLQFLSFGLSTITCHDQVFFHAM